MKLAEAVEEKIIKVEDGVPTRETDTALFPGPPIDISDSRVANPNAYSPPTSSNGLDSRRY